MKRSITTAERTGARTSMARLAVQIHERAKVIAVFALDVGDERARAWALDLLARTGPVVTRLQQTRGRR